jgi:hypothetical protein
LSLLLRQLDNLVEARREPLLQPLGRGLLGVGRVALTAIGIGRSRSAALACVAADRTAIAALVVGAVAPGGLVQSCPPADPASFDLRWLGDHRCLFFDVSGGDDGESWFGQPHRDVENERWVTPIAFAADNLAEAHLRSPVVFTTAGCAARFASGTPAGSLALRFLSEGTAALVASSASTYGASTPPLAGADLLANSFWRHLQDGNMVGDALQLARRSLAQTEIERQGYLDGDDQKTLLEFNVYGDPLFRLFEERRDAAVTNEEVAIEAGDCLCKEPPAGTDSASLDRKQIREAIEFLTVQHPELASGSIRVQRRSACVGACSQSAHPRSVATRPGSKAMITFVTARSDVVAVASPSESLARLGRVTLDEEGQVVKIITSR